MHFFNDNVWISIRISLKFVSQALIDNTPALNQKMAWRRPGDKLLSETMLPNSSTHIRVTRLQTVINGPGNGIQNRQDPTKFLWHFEWSTYLSSTWREFDPDTAYVVCISVSLGFPYMVSISLGFPYMVMMQTFKRKHHCSGCSVAMDASLFQEPLLWRHYAMAVIVSRGSRGPERDNYQRPGNANSRRSRAVNRSIICWISMRSVAYFFRIATYI